MIKLFFFHCIDRTKYFSPIYFLFGLISSYNDDEPDIKKTMSTKRGKNISKQEDKNKSYKKTTLRDKRQITFIIIVVVLRLKLRTMYRAIKTGFHIYKDLNMNPIHKINKNKRGVQACCLLTRVLASQDEYSATN